jgi:hypothetical protein
VNERELREAIRRRYAGRCGNCGVHETEVGAELELDHFQPRSAGGSDALDNLVYCCPAYNRNKGDFWPSGGPDITTPRLLHPLHDDMARHCLTQDDGTLRGLTEAGQLHIARLRLNRPQLVAGRLRQRRLSQLEGTVASARQDLTLLRQRVGDLEQALDMIQAFLERLLRP